MKKLYAIADNNLILRKICAFQRTMWYPAAFAVFAALACNFDLDIVFIYFIMASSVFAALFNEDFKPILVTILFTYFTLGMHGDVAGKNLAQYEAGLVVSDIIQLAVCAVIIIAAIVFRLASNGDLKAGLKKHTFTASILAMCTAFALNGAFYSGYSVNSLIMAVIEIGGFLPVYYIVLCGLKPDKSLIPHICKLCAICAGMVILEVLILMAKLAPQGLLISDGGVNRDHILLGWGVNNLIGGVLAMLILPVMYLAYSEKKLGILWTAWAAFILFVIFLIQCRSALLVGVVVFLAALAICCVKGNNRKPNRIAAVAAGGAGVIFLILALSGGIDKLLPHILGGDTSGGLDNGRFEMWAMSWDNFVKNPVFGVGFGESAYPPTHLSYGTALLLQNLYHNIGIQFFTTMGVVGVLAFGFHLFELGRYFFRSRDAGVIFIGMSVAAIILMSLFDNFFFYPCISIFYVVFLAVAELGKSGGDTERTAEHGSV